MAINKNNSNSNINECVDDCFSGINKSYSIIHYILIHLIVADLNKICLPCHSDCVAGQCHYGNNSDYCTKCTETNKYLYI